MVIINNSNFVLALSVIQPHLRSPPGVTFNKDALKRCTHVKLSPQNCIPCTVSLHRACVGTKGECFRAGKLSANITPLLTRWCD